MRRANIMSVLKNIMHVRYVENQTIFFKLTVYILQTLMLLNADSKPYV